MYVLRVFALLPKLSHEVKAQRSYKPLKRWLHSPVLGCVPFSTVKLPKLKLHREEGKEDEVL